MRFNASHTVSTVRSVSDSGSASVSSSSSGGGGEKGGQCVVCMAPLNVLCGQHLFAVQLLSTAELLHKRKEVISNPVDALCRMIKSCFLQPLQNEFCLFEMITECAFC